MLVKYWMNAPVITIEANATFEKATALIKLHDISTLPVMEKTRVVGVVTMEELSNAIERFASDQPPPGMPDKISNLTVKEIMQTKITTIPLVYTVEETAELMLKKGINSISVVDGEGRLSGIITRSDILKAFICLTGVQRKGIQFALQIKDCPGAIKGVTDTIRSHGGRLMSILTSSECLPEGYRIISYIRMYGIDRFKLRSLMNALQEQAKLIYLREKTEVRREICQK